MGAVGIQRKMVSKTLHECKSSILLSVVFLALHWIGDPARGLINIYWINIWAWVGGYVGRRVMTSSTFCRLEKGSFSWFLKCKIFRFMSLGGGTSHGNKYLVLDLVSFFSPLGFMQIIVGTASLWELPSQPRVRIAVCFPFAIPWDLVKSFGRS